MFVVIVSAMYASMCYFFGSTAERTEFTILREIHDNEINCKFKYHFILEIARNAYRTNCYTTN